MKQLKIVTKLRAFPHSRERERAQQQSLTQIGIHLLFHTLLAHFVDMLNTHYCCRCLRHVWWSPQKNVFIYALWSDPNVRQTICWITTARPLLQKLEVLHWNSNFCFLHLANTYSIARNYCFLVKVLMAKQRTIRTNRAVGTSISIIPNMMMAAAVFAREPPTPGIHFHCWFYENILHQDFHCIGSPTPWKPCFQLVILWKDFAKDFSTVWNLDQHCSCCCGWNFWRTLDTVTRLWDSFGHSHMSS
jgi:hypothetical protein